jgi:hypothetical protein
MNLMAIWERGIWLADAANYFATKALREQLDSPEIPVTPLSEMIGGHLVAQIPEPEMREKFSSLVRGVHGLTKTYSARYDASQAMNDRVLEWLRNGKLIALGFSVFPVPRNSASEPEQIPADLFVWDNIKGWKGSSIRAAGLEFVSVRVLPPHWIEQIKAELAQLPEPEPAARQRRLPGRPSSESAITAAVRSLIAEGMLPNAKMRKENITLVRARVHELFPSHFPRDKGLAEETIAKYLAEELPHP